MVQQRVLLYLFALFFLSINQASSDSVTPKTSSVVAITWNMGNKTAQDDVVLDLIKAIKINGFPDIVMIGTQEEMAIRGQELNNKILIELNKLPVKYKLAAANSHQTTAGAGKGVDKTTAVSVLQKTRVSKILKLPENRTSLTLLIKDGYDFKITNNRIYYPPGKTQANNSFIVIEGNLQKNNDPIALSISATSVHLNSHSDQVRREHANYFFQDHFRTPQNYDEILKEAKRFDLIMGDFNERNYLMMNNSAVDKGYLTNFMAYGYDFSQSQEKPSFVYGTYGFTKTYKIASRFLTPEPVKDTRNRLHNAKAGFLDRIVFTSGLSVQTKSSEYGAVLDPNKFEQKKKLLYAQSDHLPVMRYFTIISPKGNAEDDQIVQRYINRRLPNFNPDIADIKKIASVQQPALAQLASEAKQLMFYDTKDTTEQFLARFSPDKRSFGSVPLIVAALRSKEAELTKLQTNIQALRDKIQSSRDPQFLMQVFNKITRCNQDRNAALEQIDNKAITLQWYIPNSLLECNFHCYNSVVLSALQ